MTTSTAISAQGTIIQVENSPGSPFEFVTIGNVKSFSGLESGSGSEIDVTDLTSTSKEYLIGLRDNGSVTLNLNYYRGDAGQIICESRRADQAKTNFRITLPAGPTPRATFAGFVKKFDKNGSVDSAATSTIEIRVTGDVTWS